MNDISIVIKCNRRIGGYRQVDGAYLIRSWPHEQSQTIRGLQGPSISALIWSPMLCGPTFGSYEFSGCRGCFGRVRHRC